MCKSTHPHPRAQIVALHIRGADVLGVAQSANPGFIRSKAEERAVTASRIRRGTVRSLIDLKAASASRRPKYEQNDQCGTGIKCGPRPNIAIAIGRAYALDVELLGVQETTRFRLNVRDCCFGSLRNVIEWRHFRPSENLCAH